MVDKLLDIFDNLTRGARIEELNQLAQEYNLGFQKRLDFAKERIDIKGFKLFGKKGAKRLLGVISILSESFEGSVRFYDYMNTRDLETYTTSVVEVYCAQVNNPYVKIEPKNAFDKMKGFFVSEQKQFENIDAFYQNFQISTKQEGDDFWLKPAALQHLLNFPGITLEAEGSSFIFYIRKKKLEVPQIIPRMDFAEEFVRLICFDYSGDFV